MPPKYDKDKYQVSADMPERFSQVIPGMGVQHFAKEHLSNNDLKALVSAKNKYVSQLKEGKEKPSFTDIDSGTYPG